MTFKKPIHWNYIVTFYSIAFLLSLPFTSGYYLEQYNAITKGSIFYNLAFLPACIGTFIAAILAFIFDKKTKRTITFFGINKFQNSIITIIPLIVFSIVGLPNELNLNPHYYAFLISIVIFIYSFGEEIFWRGYLLNALSPLSKIQIVFVLGLLWWAWHFPFTSVFGLTTFLVIIIISTFLIGKFVETSKSYLTAAGIHSLIVVMNLSQNNKNALISGGITIFIWVILSKLWKPKIEV